MDSLDFDEFCIRYASEHLAGLSRKSRDLWGTAMAHIIEVVQPVCLDDVDSDALSRLQARWRKSGLSEATIGTYLATIAAALSWAHSVEILDSVPHIRRRKHRKGLGQLMRSRPVTHAEFEAMRIAVASVRPAKEVDAYRDVLDAMYLAGLRVGEVLSLSWDRGPMQLRLEPYPHFQIHGSGHKSRRDVMLPLTPDFAVWAEARSVRQGAVICIPTHRADTLSKRVSEFGKAANVVVNENGKFASAHDLRRSFASRWEPRVSSETLRLLMRHSSIQTTHNYYVQQEAERVWESLCQSSSTLRLAE